MKKLILISCFFLPFFLAAQLVEDFTDGDFTNNPTWIGTTADFEVNSSSQLQTSASVASTSYLSTNNSLADLDDVEWRFYLKQGFAGSGSNFTKIFLTLDDATFANIQNGYYLLFGEAGSNDAIKLYKITSGITTLILTGTLGAVSGSFTAGVKITHNAIGEWKLYADYTGGTNYALEGSVTDVNSVAQPYFGIGCSYTASNIKKITLDDIYVGSEQLDIIAPTISNISVLTNQSVQVTFNEEVDADIVNQLISTTPILALNTITQETNPAIVTLDFSSAFTNGVTYTATIPSVKDVAGNDTSLTFNFTYLVAEVPAIGDVIINEVLADPTPAVGLPEYDYVELYNRSTKILNLQNWTVSNNTTTATITNSIWLLPNEYVVLTSSGAIPQLPNAKAVTSFPNFKNASDDVILADDNNNQLDKITYTIDWYKDFDKKDGGYSLERINPDLVCSSENNWMASTAISGGTPGLINSVNDNTPDVISPIIDTVIVIDMTTISVKLNETVPSALVSQIVAVTSPVLVIASITQDGADFSKLTIHLSNPLTTNTNYTIELQNLEDCEGNSGNDTKAFIYLVAEVPAIGDVIINEVLADPTPAVGLPEYDYVELYNRSTKILNLQNWTVSNNTTTATITNSIWLLPNEYVVLTSSGAIPQLPNAKAVTSFPNFKNASDDVILADDNNNQLDKITYTIDWYKDFDKKDGGYSLERINPDLVCSGENNWMASTAISGGTSGLINSVNDNTPDVSSPLIDTVIVVDLTTISVKLNEIIPSAVVSQIVAIGTPSIAVSSITQDVSDLSKLIIHLSNPIATNTSYSLELQNLEDCEGNNGNSTKAFIYNVSETPSSGDIIINEVMVDPSPVVGLPEYEYVEIYNRSNKHFNLKGWKVGNDNSFGTINTSVWIAPNEYKVLASSSGVSQFTNSVYVSSFPAYKNAADKVILLDSAGDQMDQIAYTLDWYKDDFKKDGGFSLERINSTFVCSDVSNWKASNDILGGTPGLINSVYSTEPDTIAPTIYLIKVTSDSTLTVVFSEPIGGNTTVTFQITPTISITTIDRDTNNLALFYLQLGEYLQPSTQYVLTVLNSEDCQGNTNPSDQQEFVLAHLPASGDVIINELLFNPLTGGSDFLELKNVSDKIFNLYGLKLTNTKTGASNNTMINSDYYLYPQGIVVLTPDTLFQQQNYPFTSKGNFIKMSIPAMSNDASTVRLFIDSLTTIDSLTYSEKWHFKLLDDRKGKSLERVSDVAPSTVPESWHTAAESFGFATPGLENSQNTSFLYNGTLTLSSATISADNDGFEDVLMMTYEMDDNGYVGSVTIYDDRGREVRKLVKNELLGVRGEFIWDGLNNVQQKAVIGTHIIVFDGYHVSTGKTFKVKKVVVVAGNR